MLKAIVLRIAAFLLIVAGELLLLLGCEYAPRSLIGCIAVIGCVALLVACFLLALYCWWKADDLDELNNRFRGRQPHNPPTYQKGKPMAAPKHPRRYYNVTVGTDGDPEIYTHMSKLNVANIVKMALDVIEDAPAASLFVSIEREPECVTKMLHSNNAGRKHYGPEPKKQK